jgi:hypothetical protein
MKQSSAIITSQMCAGTYDIASRLHVTWGCLHNPMSQLCYFCTPQIRCMLLPHVLCLLKLIAPVCDDDAAANVCRWSNKRSTRHSYQGYASFEAMQGFVMTFMLHHAVGRIVSIETLRSEYACVHVTCMHVVGGSALVEDATFQT